VEVILRGECVEMAQPGDRCDFTGTLIVVPDISQMSAPGKLSSFVKATFDYAGARADPSAKTGQTTGGKQATANDGLMGLKALGVRDMTYKMAFLACGVSTQNPKVSVC
jgi:DNA replication licensing factor MCM6